MAVIEQRPQRSPGAPWWERAERLAESAAATASAASLHEALAAIAQAAASGTGADVAAVRVADSTGALTVQAVVAGSRSRAAEVEGSRLAPEDVVDGSALPEGNVPAEVRRLADRLGAEGALYVPATLEGHAVGAVDLYSVDARFGASDLAVARLAAGQIALAVRLLGATANGGEPRPAALDPIALAGGVLGAISGDDVPAQLAGVAAEAARARAGRLWRQCADGTLVLWSRDESDVEGEDALRADAEAALTSFEALLTIAERETCLSIPLGRPPSGVLQLVFADRATAESASGRLPAFAAQASRALRSGDRARSEHRELERSRALLAALEQAIAQLSLPHVLETVVARAASLLAVERLALYLKEPEGLVVASARGLEDPQTAIADHLLEVALGPFRGRGVLTVAQVSSDERLSELRRELAEAELGAALAAPLVANEEVIGLLALYPERDRTVSEEEEDLLSMLAAQLSAVVQNARLHEQAKELGVELEAALDAERLASRRLRALFEISHSFAESLSLEATLEAMARTVVENLELDAAVIRVPDARGDALVIQALHVANPRLVEGLTTMFSHAEVFSKVELARRFRRGRPLVLDPVSAASLGGSFALLVPFLDKGSTGAVVPLATPTAVLATLTLLSLNPARPVGRETIDAAASIASQAALALENAHLYQQQKQFAEEMQRALLPRRQPEVPGLELGIVYESSGQMELGGDVYDFMALEDGRFAVILGDVTGHGIDAAADMAMAKFVFRSIVREHPEPAEFLAQANEVVTGEIAVGKFITLLYLTIDADRGGLACAGAGHPPPRLVRPDGAVVPLEVSGLALGIDGGQSYAELRETLEPGAAVVLYTDGVIEARSGGELYGMARLDEALARLHDRPPQALARALIDDCRRFGGGELTDDCAVVVVRRCRPGR